MKLFFAVLFITSLCGHLFAAELQPFRSDGCSSFPDGTLSQNRLWLQCCIEHDKSYWAGGTRKQRQAADEALKNCVSKVGQADIAMLMLAGVRVGGTPYLPTSFRWGYGWPFPRGYRPLTKKELAEVRKRLGSAADK